MGLNTTPPTFATGEVVTAAKMNTVVDGIQAPWTAYIPTWTAVGGGSQGLGDGALGGYYLQVGKRVDFWFRLTWGATTTGGTGTWIFSLPVASFLAGSGHPCNFNIILAGTSTAYTAISLPLLSGTYMVMEAITAPGTVVAVDATHPFTWGNNCSVTVNGTYQAA